MIQTECTLPVNQRNLTKRKHENHYYMYIHAPHNQHTTTTIALYLSPTELVDPPILRKACSALLGLSLLAELVGLFGLSTGPRKESTSPSPSWSRKKCQRDSALSRIGLAGGEMEKDWQE